MPPAPRRQPLPGSTHEHRRGADNITSSPARSMTSSRYRPRANCDCVGRGRHTPTDSAHDQPHAHRQIRTRDLALG
jgi:hypothetical protein